MTISVAVRRSWTSARRAAALGAGFAVAVALAGGVPQASAQDDGGKKVLVVGKVGLNDFEDLNPLDSGWVIQGEINNLMYEPMMTWGQKDYAPAPGIVEKWEFSPDGKTWTYHFDPKAKWSDGKPITSKDAKFTLDLIKGNEVLAGSETSLVDPITSVEAPDEHTLVVTLDKPSGIMNHMNNFHIMPEHVWSKIAKPEEYQGEPGQPTSGPFTLKEFRPKERVVLEANKNYWRKPVAYDELVFQNYETAEAAVQAMQAGEIDFLDSLNPEQATALEKTKGIKINRAPSRHLDMLEFNTGAQTRSGEKLGDGHPALEDPAVRQAIHHVIDKDQLIERILDGNGTPGVGLVAPIFPNYYWDPGADKVEVSAEAGNKLLDDAGYTQKNGDGIRIDPRSKRPLSFRLLYHSDRPAYADVVDFLVTWVKELGIELKPESKESDPLNKDGDAGKFDITFGAWNFGPDPGEDYEYYTCDRGRPEKAEPTGLTMAFWCNEDFDTLQAAEVAEPDVTKRGQIVKDMQKIEYDQAPQIVLWYDYALEAYSGKWTGFGTLPSSGGAIARQQSYYGYAQAHLVGGDEGDGGDSGSSTGVIAGAAVAGVVVIGGIVFFVQRRRTVGERE
ncbi:Periplasmic oligopeptide-binding protein [Streptomyces sp. RB5]|uniref:Periplasmic oligopeptide-binding protein n=1 Tax=Streptomyces smaragdinus TaxID=2585196 RepID=A0A7K0CW16_9ACTN|nr:ABC transporter substrate-binding protein [Streptomyces smaragdinus]MQY16854.1 Periplasmic oligopeptide-binding protein [Streptomyces smaragdinus]